MHVKTRYHSQKMTIQKKRKFLHHLLNRKSHPKHLKRIYIIYAWRNKNKSMMLGKILSIYIMSLINWEDLGDFKSI